MQKQRTRRKTHKLITLFLGFLLLTFVNVSKSNAPLQASAWSGTQTSNYGAYYDSVSTETGNALKSKLKTITSSPKPSTSYDWTRFQGADEAEGIPNSILLIYSRKVVLKTATVNVNSKTGWNREHTYPQSKLEKQTSTSVEAKKDNHHIFADDNRTNSIRSNNKFGEVATTSGNRVKDSFGDDTNNYTNGTYFMPNPEARGEVARGTMYLNMFYNYDILENFTSIDLMLKRHLENPVTNREIYRNNYIHTVQKNRNPFIDKPEYACLVWGNENSTTQSLCGAQQQVDVSSVSLSPTSATISLQSPNITLPLSATVLPANASNKALTWASSNNNVATVSSSGIVSAKAVGSTTITATSVDNNTKKATATITVTNDPIPVTGISFDEPTITLKLYNEQMLNPIISPSAATDKNVTWSSSNSSVVAVTNAGLAAGMSVGSATITATTVDGEYSANVVVNVVDTPPVTTVKGNYYNTNGNGVGTIPPTVEQMNFGDTISGTKLIGFNADVIKDIKSTQAYFGRGGGVAVGSGSNPGFIKITLNNEYATKQVEVIFNDTKVYGDPIITPNLQGANGVSYTLTNGTIGSQYSGLSAVTPYVITFDEEVNYFEVHSNIRVAIVEIAIIIESAPEITPHEEAEQYSTYFLNSTAHGCDVSDAALLFNAWEFAEDEFDDLSFVAKTIMQDTAGNASSADVVAQAKARYDFIRFKYGFNDFMSGEQYYAKPVVENNYSPSLIYILILTVSVATMYFVVIRKRRAN